MMEDDVTHHIYEDDTRTLTEEIQLKRNYAVFGKSKKIIIVSNQNRSMP